MRAEALWRGSGDDEANPDGLFVALVEVRAVERTHQAASNEFHLLLHSYRPTAPSASTVVVKGVTWGR